MSSFLSHRRRAFAPSGAFDGFGNASRSFDGLNDKVVIGDVLDSVFAGTGKKWTIAAWVKSEDLDNDLILSKWHYSAGEREFFFRVTTSGELAISMSSDGTSSNRWGRKTGTGVITVNNWHHIAVTYDQTATGDYLRIWVDGTEQTSLIAYNVNGTFTSIYNGTSNLQISGLQSDSLTIWEGNIADVRVYDTDIPDSAIEGLAIGTDYQTNLVGWWLDDDDDVLDNAGSNDGTNNGSTYDNTDAPNL